MATKKNVNVVLDRGVEWEMVKDLFEGNEPCAYRETFWDKDSMDRFVGILQNKGAHYNVSIEYDFGNVLEDCTVMYYVVDFEF